MSAYPRPFDPADFPAIPAMVAPRPKEVAKELRARAAVNARGVVRISGPKAALVTGLWFENVDNPTERSQSFCNHEEGRTAVADPVDSNKHFHFLPTIDRTEIRWSIAHPELAAKAVFELWSSHDNAAALATKEYVGGEAAQVLAATDGKGNGPLDDAALEILGDATRFPGHCANAAYGPYQLRLTVTCGQSDAVTTAWTYFDVLVHSIELHWGPESWIPATPVPDTSAMLQARTTADETALLKRLKGVQKATDPEVTAVATTGDIPVRLRSTMAGYGTCYEWYGYEHDFAYLRHRARWGAGPRIPMYAEIYLKRMDGTKLDPDAGHVTRDVAGAALGPVKLLWDWHDRTLADRTNAENRLSPDAGAFVLRALDYKLNTGDEPPDCRNCHLDRGGKRGGPERIFPPHPGTGSLPFEVTECGTRKWAALSKAVVSGANACRAGVLFQPSRMAADSYRVTVMLAVEPAGATVAVDTVGKIDVLLAANPGLPTTQTGMMEIQRQIDARYIRKDTYSAVNRGLINASYGVAGLHIEWLNEADPSFGGLWTKPEYDTHLQTAIALGGLHYSDREIMGRRYSDNGGFNHKKKIEERIQKLLTLLNTLDPRGIMMYDHWFGCEAGTVKATPSDVCLTFPSRDVVIGHYRDRAVQGYITRTIKIEDIKNEKKKKTGERVTLGDTRYSNDKLRKWNQLKANNVGVNEKTLRKTFFDTSLTGPERNKVDKLARTYYEADGWKNWDSTDEYNWAVFQYDAGSIDIIMEMCLLRILQEPYEGVTFFHYINSWQTVDASGATKASNWGLGGVAKTEMAGDLGLKSMFFLWDHPTDGRRARGLGLTHMMSGDVTAVHEFGHNLHLPHAFSGESIWMHDGNLLERGDDPTQKATAPARRCVMNYHLEDAELCGVCRLRLRGWGFLRVDSRQVTGFDSTDPSKPGKPPELRFATFNRFFTDLTY